MGRNPTSLSVLASGLALCGLLAGGLAGCAGQPGGAQAVGVGACGGPPPAPGPEGCALICRAVIPVHYVNDTPQMTVWINDRPVDLILDTGAGTTVITPAAVASLGLGPPEPAEGQVFGIGGAARRQLVSVQSLAFGDVRVGPRKLDVAAFGHFDVPPMGSLGTEILSRFEVDLDLPHNTVRLYQGRACPGPLPGWISSGYTVPFSAEFSGRQPIVPIRLDGQALEAVVDTGAGASGISIGFAQRANVSAAELASELATTSSGVGSGSSAGRRHMFQGLDIGTEHVAGFEADVLDLHLRSLEALLGEDFLRQRKVWISYGRRELTISGEW